MNRAEIQNEQWQFPFVIYMPKDCGGPLPLVVQLHGVGEAGSGGDDLAAVDRHGFSCILSEDKEYPCIVVMPQCKPESFWAAEIPNVYAFIQKLIDRYPVDLARVSLAGISMGAYGTWLTASRYPELFAAIAPVCGGGMVWKADALTMPIWAFHGTEDDCVYPTESLNMIHKIRRQGNGNSDVRLTMLDGVGHNAWDFAYNEELLLWLISKTK